MVNLCPVVYYPKGKKWEERFYQGVVSEVGDTVLRKWDGEKKKTPLP